MYFYSILSLQCIIGRFSTMAVFSCFVSVERLCSHVLVYISRNKSKTGPEWKFFSCLIYCVNDFLLDFLIRLKSPDRLDGNENSMFTCRRPLGLIEENLKVGTQYGTSPCNWSLRLVSCDWFLQLVALCKLAIFDSKSSHRDQL